jgi:hypothetical protein
MLFKPLPIQIDLTAISGMAVIPADAGPDGQITALFFEVPVQSLLKKYSDFPKAQISPICSPSTPLEGRIAIVTDAGLDAMDADAPLTNGA